MLKPEFEGRTNEADDARTLPAKCQGLDQDSGSAAALAAETAVLGDARRGGPRTSEGKSVSRLNALKHGLSATRLLPEILGRDLVEQHHEALCGEWQPATPTEEFLLRDMARHQAALARIEQIELAVLRRGACNPLNLGVDPGTDDQLNDVILAAAGTSEAIERISRYRRQHERAFLRGLAVLQEAKKMALSRRTKMPVQRQRAFSSDEECEAYLAERVKKAGFDCPQCNSRNAKWLASRGVWQCCACRRQVGIRAGTVLEGSRVGLLSWFRAVELAVKNPHVSTAELAAETKVGRKGTIRKMLGKIRQAMNSPDGSRLLAGLDGLFHNIDEDSAEASVSKNLFLPNEPVPVNQEGKEETHDKA